MHQIPASLHKRILRIQSNELTEALVYRKLAQKTSHNKEILIKISQDEERHAEFWSAITGKKTTPNELKAWIYILLAKIFGLSFALKLMEKGERNAEVLYTQIAYYIPEVAKIAEEENKHESTLIGLIDEERLKYIGSIVLGLNDALVELTGALAGFTLTLRNSKIIAIVGLITGIAAALSMAASEYLSTKVEDATQRSPAKSAVYTGMAYIITVLFLISPYTIITNYLWALTLVLINAILIIAFFTFYTAIAKDKDFWPRFIEMGVISFAVAAISFVIGAILHKVIGVDI